MKTKYGFVAVLDALGTRTASLGEAAKYLTLIQDIESEITTSLHVTLHDKGVDPAIFDKLSIRFFADTILITYEVKDKRKELQYFTRITFVLRMFIYKALEMGLLFRGSLSLGEYVDKDAVVLGPAVSDAAIWYEELDMVGVMVTPHAALALKHLHVRKWAVPTMWVWQGEAVLEKACFKDAKKPPLDIFLLNWVYCIAAGDEKPVDELSWFYKTMRAFPIPAGAETKFANTEAFFLRRYQEIVTERAKVEAASTTAAKTLEHGK